MKRKYEPCRRVRVCKPQYASTWHAGYTFGPEIPHDTLCGIIFHEGECITWKPSNRLPLPQDRCAKCFGGKQ